MNSNSDPEFDQFKDYDFKDALPVAEVPELKALKGECAQDKVFSFIPINQNINPITFQKPAPKP